MHQIPCDKEMIKNYFYIYIAVSLLVSGCSLKKIDSTHYYEIKDADVYLAPIGPVRQEYLTSLAAYYEDVAKIKMGIAPPLPYRGATYDSERSQFIAQNLIILMNTIYKDYSSNPNAIFIGITHSDMYIKNKDWRFAYSLRTGCCHAVLASARMYRDHSKNFDEIIEVHPGMRKMVTKTIGLLHFHRDMNSNPKSVLYGRVLGLNDLENIDESTIYADVLGQQ
jgi:predicted Zn-dependent protease